MFSSMQAVLKFTQTKIDQKLPSSNEKHRIVGFASHLLVALGELRRAPARDGMSDELTRRHEPSEADEDHHRVEARQPIRVVVVGAKLDLLDTQQRFRQSIHVANHDFVLVLFGDSFACLQLSSWHFSM